MTVTISGAALEPSGTAGLARVELQLDCQSAVNFLPVSSALEARIRIVAPYDVVPYGPQSLILDASPCPSNPLGTVTTSGNYSLLAGRQAVGDLPERLVFEAIIYGGDRPPRPTLSANATAPVTVAFRGRITVSAPELVGHEPAYFPLGFGNEGNAPSLVNLTLVSADPALRITLPTIPAMERTLTQAGTITTSFVTEVPPSSEHHFRVRFTPVSVNNPTHRGPATDLNFTVVSAPPQPVQQVPWPAVPTLFVALAAVACVRRRA